MDALIREKFALKINNLNIRVTKRSRNMAVSQMNIRIGCMVEEVISFSYLRGKVTRDDQYKENINIRIVLTKRSFFQRREINFKYKLKN